MAWQLRYVEACSGRAGESRLLRHGRRVLVRLVQIGRGSLGQSRSGRRCVSWQSWRLRLGVDV